MVTIKDSISQENDSFNWERWRKAYAETMVGELRDQYLRLHPEVCDHSEVSVTIDNGYICDVCGTDITNDILP